MASGKTHDRSIIFSFPLVALVLAQQGFSTRVNALFTLSYLIGGLWFSPDIDMAKSRPSQRWFLLRFYWVPYQKLFPHRGWFVNRNVYTHAPIIGTAIRLAYLLSVPSFIAFHYGLRLQEWGLYLLIAFLAVEVASMLHLLLDVCDTWFKKH
jgi:uncharacterized metal-binding protein